MVLNQWWAKLLFYLLYVGTENDLIIYRLSMNNESRSITNLKLIIVSSLVGKRIKAVP